MPKRTSKTKRDVNQTAYDLVQKSTGTESDDEPSQAEISRIMAKMGRKGGKIGGKRRLEKMTAEQRSAVASKAARVRWQKD